ncbi:MAG: ABC transporter permease [Magnetococcales bacterium]|nr:ABC transporter permease [Magnetococcales bacterium]
MIRNTPKSNKRSATRVSRNKPVRQRDRSHIPRDNRPLNRPRPAGSSKPSETPAAFKLRGRALKRAWRQFHEGSLSHWITTMVIALSLTIYGVFALILANANTALESWQGENMVTVFFQENLPSEGMIEIQEALSREPMVEGLTLVPPAEALDRLKTMLGTEAGLLEDLGENPLPHSLEFRLVGGHHSAAQALANRLAELNGVEAVSYDRQWADRLSSLIRVFRFTGLCLSFLLLSAVALIISNTIKLTIIARREEVEVMRFMGATDSFIKTPFIYEGIIQGFLGGAGALGLTSLLYIGAKGAALDLGRAFGTQLHLHHLPITQFGIILGLGVLLGLTGAMISVSRFLEV